MPQTTDSLQPGLGHRTGLKRGSWLIRVRAEGKQRQLFIGHDDEMPADLAREVTRRAIEDAAKGLTPDKDWVTSIRKEYADRLIRETRQDRPTPWGWHDAMEEYLEDLSARGRSRATLVGYRTALRAIEGLEARQVQDVRLDEVAKALDVVATDRPALAFRASEVVRQWWRWLASPGVMERSGVVYDMLGPLQPPAAANRASTKRTLKESSVDEVARIVRECRSGVLPTSVSRATETVCLTGLKLAQVTGARSDAIRDGVWIVGGGVKLKRFRLPLPPRLRELLVGNGEFLFPEVHRRDLNRPAPLSTAAVMARISYLAGPTNAALRSTMASALVEAGFSKDEVENLHRRVSEDPVDEAVAVASRGFMLRRWQELVEERLGTVSFRDFRPLERDADGTGL